MYLNFTNYIHIPRRRRTWLGIIYPGKPSQNATSRSTPKETSGVSTKYAKVGGISQTIAKLREEKLRKKKQMKKQKLLKKEKERRKKQKRRRMKLRNNTGSK